MRAEYLTSQIPITAAFQQRSHRFLLAAVVITFAAVVTLSSTTSLGSRIEIWLFPVFSHQAISLASVVRSDLSLCWTWERKKVRAPKAVNIDVTLDTADGDTYAPEIFNGASGEPWHAGGALPPGTYQTQFCTAIPATISKTTPVRVRQVLAFRGFMGLWTIHVPLPNVIAD